MFFSRELFSSLTMFFLSAGCATLPLGRTMGDTNYRPDFRVGCLHGTEFRCAGKAAEARLSEKCGRGSGTQRRRRSGRSARPRHNSRKCQSQKSNHAGERDMLCPQPWIAPGGSPSPKSLTSGIFGSRPFGHRHEEAQGKEAMVRAITAAGSSVAITDSRPALSMAARSIFGIQLWIVTAHYAQ